MKFLGQYIQSFTARFRDDVYLESISTGTIASGAHLGLDSNNKIVKAVDGGGDLTGITAGVGLSGSSLTGPVPTLTVDFSEFSTVTPTSGDFLATLDSDGANEQKTSTDNLATLFAGTGLTASSAVIGVDAAQTQITSIGTIATGVWQGTAVATNQQKHLMHYQTTGYAAGDDTNYEMARPMSVNTAPFQLNESIGTDGLTSKTIQVWARAGGHVMPRACTLTRWSGWATSDGSATTYLALFKVELEDDVDSDPSAELLTEMTYTASGNATANFVETTSASTGGTLSIEAGDIVFFAMKGPGNSMYFNGTFEVEF